MAEDDESLIDPAEWQRGVDEERKKIGRFNLAIIGGTGVGKSTLVNSVFGEDRAATGIGLPVTQGVSYHVSDTGTFGVWDFEGFEIGDDKDPSQLLAANLAKISASDPLEQISVVWYCVGAASARLTDADIEAIRTFHAAGLKVILVLTKVARSQSPVTRKWTYADDAAAFADWLRSPTGREGEPIDLPIEAVELVAAIDQGSAGGPAHGLDELLLVTFQLSPDGHEDALRVSQRISLSMKKDLARRYIAAAAVAAGGAAAQPFPVADAALLAPIQIGMMRKIATVYEVDKGAAWSASALVPIALKFSGRAAARSLLKLIPGIGSVINATVAVTLTWASGIGWRRFCEAVHTGQVDTSSADEAWKMYGPSVVELGGIFARHGGTARGAAKG